MKKHWKTLALFVVISLVATVLVACGDNNNGGNGGTQNSSSSGNEARQQEQQEQQEKPLVVNVLSMDSNVEVPRDGNRIHQWLLENMNIDIRLEVSSGEVPDQMNMMLAGGEIPDVVIYPTNELANSIANRWADGGLTIQTDELLAQYPNILRYSDQKYNESVYANADGNMYMIPANPANHPELILKVIGFMIKEDWLTQVGMDAPKTPDELFDVLMAFKEQISDVDGRPIIPMTLDHGGRQHLMYTWTGGNWYDLSDDYQSLNWWFNHPGIVDYMLFMNKLYKNGLLDRETLTQQPDQFQAKLSSGRVGFTFGTHNPMETANSVLKVNDPASRYVPNPSIRVEGSPLPVYQTASYNMFQGLVISKKFAENEANLERLMEFLAWNATDEGAFLLNHGPEGEFFVLNDDGLYEPTPEVQAELDKGDLSFEVNSGTKMYNLLNFPVAPDTVVDTRSEEFKMADTIWAEGVQPDDNIFNPAGTGPEWDKHWGNLWPEIERWEARAIFADTEEEVIQITNEMLEHFEKIGAPEVTAEKLELIEAYLNN